MAGKSEPGKRGFQPKASHELRVPRQFHLEQSIDEWLTKEADSLNISRSELLNRVLKKIIER